MATDAQSQPLPSFEADARATLQTLAHAWSEVVESALGTIPRPAELGRGLDLDRKLAWKIARVVTATDPFAAVEHIPGAAGVDIFLDAAATHGVPADRLQRARDAQGGFERLVRTHAGDRLSLEMMARGFVASPSEQVELNRRRDAFLGHSYTWGVQARTQLSANVVFASQTADEVDVALVSGLVDLRRLRPHVAWVVARTGYVGASPAGGNGDTPRIPLLAPFCSQPLPALRTNVTGTGSVEIEVDAGPVGDTGAMTCILADEPIRRAGHRYRRDEDPSADLHVHIRTPARVLLHDLIVQRDLFGPLTPSAAVYSEVHHEIRSSRDLDDRYRLPVPVSVTYLGHGPSVLRTPDVPRYPDLARHVLERCGVDPEVFDVYRLRMEYPIVPTAVSMSFDLPAR